MNLNFKGQADLSQTPIYRAINNELVKRGGILTIFGLTDAWWGMDDDGVIVNPAALAHADIPPFEVKENHAP